MGPEVGVGEQVETLDEVVEGTAEEYVEISQGEVRLNNEKRRVFNIDGEEYCEIARLGDTRTNKTYLVEGPQGRAVLKSLKDRVKLSENDDDLSQTIKLFKREARTLELLDHQQIPLLYKVFKAEEFGDEGLYLIQEFFEGDDLKTLVQRYGTFEPAGAAQILLSALDPLNYLHSRTPEPIIHRDVKPANILWDGSAARLVDLGSVLDRSVDTIGGSTVAGTRGYMAPEQWLGQATAQSDIYGIGATLLEMVTGKSPEEFTHDLDSLDTLDFKKRFSLNYEDQITHLDEKIQEIIGKCLAFDPKDRYSSVAQLQDALEEYLQSPVVGKKAAAKSKKKSGSKAGKIMAGVAACISISLLGLGVSHIIKDAIEDRKSTHFATNNAVLVDEAGYVTQDQHTPDELERFARMKHLGHVVYDYPRENGIVNIGERMVLGEAAGKPYNATYPVKYTLSYKINDPVAAHLFVQDAVVEGDQNSGKYELKRRIDAIVKENINSIITEDDILHYNKELESGKNLIVIEGDQPTFGGEENTPAYRVKQLLTENLPEGIEFIRFKYHLGNPKAKYLNKEDKTLDHDPNDFFGDAPE